jgi:GAF domain-containing protein
VIPVRSTGPGTGFRAVHAVPMSLHSDVVGGLLLFSHRAGTLSEADRRTVRLLATAAATGLVHRRAFHQLETVNGQLRQALTSRIAIEQAKGFLAARRDVTPGAAFDLLRVHARRTRQRLTASPKPSSITASNSIDRCGA